jgi:hypothetical protein
MEQEPVTDSHVPQPARSLPRTPRPVMPAAIEQVIERTSASFNADVQALRAELRHRLQGTGSQTTDPGSGPLEHQETLAVRTEPLTPGASDREVSTLPGASARSLPAAPGPQRRMARSSEPRAWRQGQRRIYAWWDELWLQGQMVSYRHIVVIWIVCLIIGFGIGAVIAFAIR